ncbi:MAG: ribose-phosphate diphosphokinase, partial [Candidatus Omnitrophica bacterium]|nr:ribose-phosphate diphosphokinase [Candidatus Omnitrophota bacterium]
MILTDNAGETVLVMLLVKFLLEMGFNVSIASRDTPVINDMTVEDTKNLILRMRRMGYFSGYSNTRLEAISSGARVFATPPATLSQDFLYRFQDSNTFCVIAMGQGNTESLWQMQVKKPFVHILMAKSPERIKEFVGIPKHSAMLVVNLPLPAGDIIRGEIDLPKESFSLAERQDLVAVLNELGVTIINVKNIYIYPGDFEDVGSFAECFDAKGITLDAAGGPIYLGQAKFGQDVTVKSTGGVVIRGGAVIGDGAYIENSSIVGVSISAGENVIRRRAELIDGVPIRFRHSGVDSLSRSQNQRGSEISALSVNKPLFCELLNLGVKISGNPENIYIARDVRIGRGAKIYSDVVISGNAEIGEDAEIGPRAFINDTKIGPGAKVVSSKLENCLIYAEALVEGVEVEGEEIYPYCGETLPGRKVSGFIIDPALNRGVDGILSVRVRRQQAKDNSYSLVSKQPECSISKIKEEYPLWYKALLYQIDESISAARDLLIALKEDRKISLEMGDKICATIAMLLNKGFLDNLTMAQAKGVIWQIIWLYAKSPFQLKKGVADQDALFYAKLLIDMLDETSADNVKDLETKRLKLAIQFVALSNLNIFDRSRPVNPSDKLTFAPRVFDSLLRRVSNGDDVDNMLAFIRDSGYFSADHSDIIIDRLLSIPEEERQGKNIIFNVDNAGETVYSLVLIRELLGLGYKVIISANPKPIDDNYDLQDLQGLLTNPGVNNDGFLGRYLKEGKIKIISNGSINTGLDLAQVSRDFYIAVTDKETVMLFSVGYAVAKNILAQEVSFSAVSLFWGKDTKVMHVGELDVARGEAAVIFAEKIPFDPDAGDGLNPRCYPLKVPLRNRVQAEKEYGDRATLGEIQATGFHLASSGTFVESHYEVIEQRLIWLERLLGRAPPELSFWKFVVSTDLDLNQGNAASCDIDTKTVFVHPYFFGLTEDKQTEILYHELISHIATGLRDEKAAMEHTNQFVLNIGFVQEAISGLIENIRSRSENKEMIAYTSKIDELKDSGTKIIASWNGNRIFTAVFGRELQNILKGMNEGALPYNKGVVEVAEFLVRKNNVFFGVKIFDPSSVAVSLECHRAIREQLSAVYGCSGCELKKDVFPDGEIRMVIPDMGLIQGKNVIFTHDVLTNDDFVELILSIGALRDSGAKEITCIFPESILKNAMLLDIISPYVKAYIVNNVSSLSDDIFLPEAEISCYYSLNRERNLVRKKKFEQILFVENDPLKGQVSRGLMKFDSSHNLQIGTVRVDTLDKGEISVKISVDVQNKDCLFIHSTRTSKGIVELLAVLEELKNRGAGDTHVLFFFLGYDRQEKNFPAPLYGPEAFGVNAAKIFLSLVNQYCGRIYTINTHFIKEPRINAYRLEGVEGLEIVNLNAFFYLARYFVDNYQLNNPVLIAPDQGTFSFLRLLAESLGWPLRVFKKTRISIKEVVFSEPDNLDVDGRDVIILDDVISGGSTAVKLASILKNRHGASRVFVGTVHGKQSDDSLAMFRSLKDSTGLPLIDDIISTDTIASPTNRVSVSEVIVEFLREHLVTAEALDGLDTPSISLILPYRLAGAGDVVFMVNTAQKLKQIYPSLPIKVIFLKNDDYLFLSKIKLISNFDGQRNIQRLGGVTYINALDSRERMENFIGKNDLVMLYAVYADEYKGSDASFFDSIGLKSAEKITVHELGRELQWRDPNKDGHYLLGCNNDALGMPPVAPNFESYVQYCNSKSKKEIYAERSKILRKIPGYSVLDIDRTIRSKWGFVYGHLPYEVMMYFKAFNRARQEDAEFASCPVTFFVNHSQNDRQMRDEVLKMAEESGFCVFEYNHGSEKLESLVTGCSDVCIVMNTVVPRKLFGQLFTLSGDLPGLVTGQDNLSNILYVNAQSEGRVFFWEVLIFQALAEFDLKRAAEKILTKDEYVDFNESLKSGYGANYDLLYKLFSEHDKYRQMYHKLGEGIANEFSFARRIHTVIEKWQRKIGPKTYPARFGTGEELPDAGQIDNLHLYFGDTGIIFVDQTETGKVADIQTNPGKISVLKCLAARAPPFAMDDPASLSFQALIDDVIRHEKVELETGSHELACQASYNYFKDNPDEAALLFNAFENAELILDDDYMAGLSNFILPPWKTLSSGALSGKSCEDVLSWKEHELKEGIIKELEGILRLGAILPKVASPKEASFCLRSLVLPNMQQLWDSLIAGNNFSWHPWENLEYAAVFPAISQLSNGENIKVKILQEVQCGNTLDIGPLWIDASQVLACIFNEIIRQENFLNGFTKFPESEGLKKGLFGVVGYAKKLARIILKSDPVYQDLDPSVRSGLVLLQTEEIINILSNWFFSEYGVDFGMRLLSLERGLPQNERNVYLAALDYLNNTRGTYTLKAPTSDDLMHRFNCNYRDIENTIKSSGEVTVPAALIEELEINGFKDTAKALRAERSPSIRLFVVRDGLAASLFGIPRYNKAVLARDTIPIYTIPDSQGNLRSYTTEYLLKLMLADFGLFGFVMDHEVYEKGTTPHRSHKQAWEDRGWLEFFVDEETGINKFLKLYIDRLFAEGDVDGLDRFRAPKSDTQKLVCKYARARKRELLASRKVFLTIKCQDEKLDKCRMDSAMEAGGINLEVLYGEFGNKEMYVYLSNPRYVRGKDCVLFFDQVNQPEEVLKLIFTLGLLKDCSARSITCILPFNADSWIVDVASHFANLKLVAKNEFKGNSYNSMIIRQDIKKNLLCPVRIHEGAFDGILFMPNTESFRAADMPLASSVRINDNGKVILPAGLDSGKHYLLVCATDATTGIINLFKVLSALDRKDVSPALFFTYFSYMRQHKAYRLKKHGSFALSANSASVILEALSIYSRQIQTLNIHFSKELGQVPLKEIFPALSRPVQFYNFNVFTDLA